MNQGDKNMKKAFFLLVFPFLISCASTHSIVNIARSDNMQFYVLGGDQFGLNNIIIDYIKSKGYEAQPILDIKSIQRQSTTRTINRVSAGTGFFISENYIITCSHVIDDAKTITIIKDGKKYSAQMVIDNPNLDFALLIVNEYKSPKYFATSKFLNENIGNKLYTLGFPLSNILGADIRVTDGIISARTGINSDPIYFQISAPIQPGNSGGPIINEKFNVIGIASSKISDQYVMQNTGAIPQNINFGIKSDYILPMIEEYVVSTRSNISNLNDAIEATIQIIVNDNNQPMQQSVIITGEYVIDYDYNSFWDMYTRLNYLKINIYDVNTGELVAQAVHNGDDLSVPSVTTKKLMDKIFSKM
jgi:S1-C subfamily serine protease